ncbi:hypothetical protein [Leptospira noguchii]|uniref:hypothetical protein n=1 Tax=Leptospira noguchii TaxID=28182 RepID=UPI001FB83506|nr:hypothetical protein [Leptospira noguchii]UOG54551.1 hypothetical protein MAL09_14680 [Leptospira noguchii]
MKKILVIPRKLSTVNVVTKRKSTNVRYNPVRKGSMNELSTTLPMITNPYLDLNIK